MKPMKLKIKRSSKFKVTTKTTLSEEVISSCKRCRLHESRRFVVIGRGKMVDCSILFIGEAPGTSEDLLAEAFVGASGKLLDLLIKEAGLSKYEIGYTNCCLCRPCDGKGHSTREPKPEELLACSENVKWIIKRANAKFVVLVGSVAKELFYGEFPNCKVIQHPSFLVRTGGNKSQYYLPNLKVLERLRNEIEK